MSFLTYISNHLTVYLLTLVFCETLGLGTFIGQTNKIENKVSGPLFIGSMIFIAAFIALWHLLAMSIFYNLH